MALIICFITALVAEVLAVRYFAHMFQLNAYKPKVQCKWMWHNLYKMWSQILFLAVAVLSMNFTANYGSVPAAIAHPRINLWLINALFLLSAWNMRPRPAKKPLVYTHRAERLLLSTAILCLAGFYAAWAYWFFLLPLTYAATPMLVLLANYLNMPFEAWRRYTYVCKARRILRNCPDLTVIGITGSYGKTSVKYFLNTLLSAEFNTLMTPESYNTPMGVVRTIRERLSPVHEIFVCEMGAQNVGDIKELCEIAYPKHGIITALGQQHLESFKTQENIIKTKYELADALPDDGFLLVNGDNALIQANLPKHKYVTYGLNEGNDYRAFDIKVSSEGTRFAFKIPTGETFVFQTVLLGEHNIVNLAGALAMSHLLGASMIKLKPQMLKIEAVPHRLQMKNYGNVTIIDDGFNSNPSGAEAALKTLSLFEDYKIMITPGMVELGEAQEKLNFEFGKKAAEICDYVILVGAKQTKPIAEGLNAAGFEADKIYVAGSLKDGLSHAYALKSAQKKAILLENDLPDNY